MESNLKELKEKYELLSHDIKQNDDELKSIILNTFVFNPRINEITQKLKNLNDEKDKIEKEINKLEKRNG